MSATPRPTLRLPGDAEFLAPLAARAAAGDVLVTRDPDPRDPDVRGRAVRRSAVLIHIAGTGLDDARVVLEERGHALRSQPGQFSLPGGGRDPGDRDDVHTALREAQEETGLDPVDAHVLGAFAPIPMPWRIQRVTPVLSWSRSVPTLGVQDPIEVERLVWAPLTGPGSLTDPAHRLRGLLGGQRVGPAFDLPGDAFVWGFTAMILEKVLTGLGLDPVPATAPTREIPPERRR
ncbi:CoA pyrophosphatase [uncultured Brachybacterium sp.]|uniref:NUDIX hydrolase n=1 Tax=uncultured Brachybacterium sp. TaxID=189680 RepID=UPI00261EB13B|nr:CoA pyrophosphatase [uncultured Brachybacterium sp.]